MPICFMVIPGRAGGWVMAPLLGGVAGRVLHEATQCASITTLSQHPVPDVFGDQPFVSVDLLFSGLAALHNASFGEKNLLQFSSPISFFAQ